VSLVFLKSVNINYVNLGDLYLFLQDQPGRKILVDFSKTLSIRS
jgi:hypothetical protein